MKDFFTKFKRNLALALVFVLTLNFATGFASGSPMLKEVQAAETYNITGNFDKSLLYNQASIYPVESTVTSTANKDLFLQWDAVDSTEFNQLVTIPVDNNKILTMDIANGDANEVIDVSLYYTDKDGNKLPIAASTYTIYYPQENTFIPYLTYTSIYNSNDKAKVETSTAPTGTTVSDAKFTLSTGTGFTIRYGGKNYRFLWEKDKFKFYIVDEILEGFIYDVSMNGEAPLYYSKGINTSSLTSDPYANDIKYMDDKIIHEETGDPWTGESDAGLEIEFATPKWFDRTLGTFSSTHTNPINNVNIQFYIGANSATATENFTFRVSDILGAPSVLDISNKGATIIPPRTTGNIRVKIPKLNPGIVYESNTVFMNSTGATRVTFKSQELPTSISLYTFPKYKVIQYGGSLYLSLTPFVNEFGKKLMGAYVLYSNPMPDGTIAKVTNRGDFKSVVKINYSSDGKDVLNIPLTIQPAMDANDVRQGEYFIEFNLNKTAATIDETGKKCYSQTLFYEAEVDTSVVGVPEKFNVEYYNLSAKYENGVRVEGQSNLELNTSWIIGKKDAIDKKLSETTGPVDIKYSLDKSLTQDLDGEWDESANITLTLTSGSPVSISVRDNITNNTLYQLLDNVRIEEETNGGVVYYRVYVNYIFDAGTINVNDSLKEFEYPNIYFLALNYIETDPYGVENKYTSTLEDITLNDESTIEVPTASNVDALNVVGTLVKNGDSSDRSSFDVEWQTIGKDIYAYLKSIYTDTDLANADLKVYYNIYFSQKESDFKDGFYNKTYEQRVNSATNPSGQAIPYKYTDLLKPTVELQNRILFNNINGDTISLSKKPIDVVRNTSSATPYVVVENYNLTSAQVESFKTSSAGNIQNVITVDGLDLNTKYYGFIETVIVHNGLKVTVNGSLVNLQDYSKPSLIFAETTLGELSVPEPSDVAPSTPVVTVKEVNIKDATFLIDPYVLPALDDYTQTLQYEVIRLESKKMSDVYLNNKSPMATFLSKFTSDVSNKAGFRLTDDLVEKYNTSSNAYESTTDIIATLGADGTTMKDVSLNSNKIYYYYFRSVKTVTKTEPGSLGVTTYSTWIPINVTTSTIQPPKNLSVKQDETYNAQTEVPILFYGMISDPATIGEKDFFELSIKEGDGEWSAPIRMDATTLKNSVGPLGDDGYRSFLYKVTGLKPGQTYYFKIRHVLSDGTTSIYSDSLRWKTDLGDDYEDETEIDEWEDYIEEIIDGLLDTNEWVLNDTSSLYELVYRSDKWENQLDRFYGKTFKLKDMKADKVNTFYLPSYIYEDILADKINLETKYENVTFNFKNAFVNNNTQAMINMKKTLQGKNAKDYYLKITVTPQNTTTSINGETPITDKLVVDTELVAFSDKAEYWENAVEVSVKEKLLELLAKSDIGDEIEKAVTDGELAPEILDIVDDFKDEMLKESYDLIEESFKNYKVTKENQNISTYNTTISLTADKGDVDKAKGLSLNGTTYISEKTTENATTAVMNVSADGTYIFTGISYNIVGGTTDSSTKDLISDFNLYDVLTTSGKLDNSASLTNGQLAQVYANLTGKTYDESTTALTNLGVSVNDRNKSRGATNAQTLSAIMNIYEAKTGTSISSYKITNYVTYNDLKTTLGSEKLAKAVYVAKDIGVYSGSSYSSTTTVGECLAMLRALQTAIGY